VPNQKPGAERAVRALASLALARARRSAPKLTPRSDARNPRARPPIAHAQTAYTKHTIPWARAICSDAPLEYGWGESPQPSTACGRAVPLLDLALRALGTRLCMTLPVRMTKASCGRHMPPLYLLEDEGRGECSSVQFSSPLFKM